jgi:hypothetical protein
VPLWSEVKKPLPEGLFNPVHFVSIEWNGMQERRSMKKNTLIMKP